MSRNSHELPFGFNISRNSHELPFETVVGNLPPFQTAAGTYRRHKGWLVPTANWR
jgi:hypothetical protein